ncbi:MAG: hypothetical protein GY789_16610 [Hyphomicrobiales bacterium]|nr:hypothetical protein [Hyphomicrobiales bacterium]
MSGNEYSVDRPGSNIKPGFPAVTSSRCEGFCKSDLKCRSYTWVKPVYMCDRVMLFDQLTPAGVESQSRLRCARALPAVQGMWRRLHIQAHPDRGRPGLAGYGLPGTG